MTATKRNAGAREATEATTERVVMEEQEQLTGTEAAAEQVDLSREDSLFQSTSIQHESLLSLMPAPALRANAPRNVVQRPLVNAQVLRGAIGAVLAELEEFPLM